jgi:hypothetical protein
MKTNKKSAASYRLSECAEDNNGIKPLNCNIRGPSSERSRSIFGIVCFGINAHRACR